MIGDKLVIKPEHERAGAALADLIVPQLETGGGRLAVTIAGESGSGKSELAAVLAQQAGERGHKAVVLGQDDYFHFPPKSNHTARRRDLRHVGTTEVNLPYMDRNLREFLDGADWILKPLVIYEQDRAITEIVDLVGVRLVIAEGTYTTLLENARERVFIDRTFRETKKSRLERAREQQDTFLERVLEIEHAVVSRHKSRASVIVTADFEVQRV
ncbi:MAG: Bifunctional alpha-galactosidase/sucrose kinase AgaSK [Calditrichaeota bacterium]|nr:Bifunctional alpha-galactosidase/sucrose kinase AgaSK [Calditrichota bacterium]